MEQKERNEEKANWNVKPYLAVGLLTFVVFCLCLAAFFVVYRYAEFKQMTGKILSVMQPVIIGLVIAYLINPIMKFYEKYLRKLLVHLKLKKIDKLARTFSTIGAMLTLVLIIVALISMVVPELMTSIEGLIVSLPDQVDGFVKWSNQMLDSDNEVIQRIKAMVLSATDYLENWLKQDLLPQAQSYITSITTGIINVFMAFFNVIIGLIVSVYVLMEKEVFVGQIKKIIYALFKPNAGNIIVNTIRKSNQIFGGFISGKILDSAIIGVLCYIILLMMHMPYALLVSVIVGVTNVIPFFGPYIGAIPSAILIILASPIQGVYFIIFIVILQQVDGNIIGPKILGNSTGLSSFWVVFAILVGGGLFGIPGMILGVPVFAVIYYIMQNLVRFALKRKKLPPDTVAYIHAEKIDSTSNQVRYFEESETAQKDSDPEKN